MYIFDATPLIYLAKVECLTLVGELPSDCAMPRLVYDEVVTTGIEAGYPDARRVERAVEDGTISVLSATDGAAFERLRRNDHVSDADAAVLALATALDGVAVMDDEYGRSVADSEGIQTRGTAYLVLRLLAEGVVDAGEARNAVDAMLDAGWYCAPDLYAKIRRRIDDLA